MKAIILAAGRGSRLNKLTDDKPKSLTPILGKPLIEWELEALKDSGISDIAIVTGYQAEQLNCYDTHLFHNARWNKTNMLSSLWQASKWLLTDTCIVSYSDLLYTAQTVRELIDDCSDTAISYDVNWKALWQKRFSDPLFDLETFTLDDQHYLKTIGNSPASLDEIEGQYMGLLKFSPSFWEGGDFPEEDWDALSMTAFLQRMIERGKKIKGVPTDHPWMEIDHEHDIVIAESIWEREGYSFV